MAAISRCRRRTVWRCFDAALRQARSFVVPAQFDLATIRSHSAVGGLPPMFRGLIRAARRTAESAAAVEPSSDLRQRLAAMSTSEREHELLDIVRSNAAAVLGHDSARRGRRGSGVQGAGLRFAGCGRVSESAEIGDRFEVAHHRRLRSSDTDSVGPVSGPCTRHRRGFRPMGSEEDATGSNRNTGR